MSKSAKKKTAKKTSKNKPSYQHLVITELWNWIWIGVLLILVGINWQISDDNFKKYSLRGIADSPQLVAMALAAASQEDYPLAQSLYQKALSDGQNVLGAKSDIELLIYPEQAKIVKANALLKQVKKTPSRLLYLELSLLYWQMGDHTQSQIYLGLAKTLDPNDPSITKVANTVN